MDYGGFVYGSEAKTVLQRLDRIQSRGLRLCVGAFRMTPVEALQVDRRDKLVISILGEVEREFRRTSCGHSTWGMLGARTG